MRFTFMAGGEISERPDICKDVLKTPPRRRAERLACGLPAYVNCQLDGLDNPAPREIPQAPFMFLLDQTK